MAKKRFDREEGQAHVSRVSVKMFITSILHAVLTLSVILVYGGGATLIEMEHEHSGSHAAASSDSSHQHHHHDHDGHDDRHGNENPDEGEEPAEEGDSSPHRHSHVLSVDTHAVSSPARVPFPKAAFRIGEKPFPEEELRPDGPFYDLSKPPQLS